MDISGGLLVRSKYPWTDAPNIIGSEDHDSKDDFYLD